MIPENGNDFIGFPLALKPFPLMFCLSLPCFVSDLITMLNAHTETIKGRKRERKKSELSGRINDKIITNWVPINVLNETATTGLFVLFV